MDIPPRIVLRKGLFMTKRFLALFFVLCLTLLAFCGCNRSPMEEGSTTEETSITEAPTLTEAPTDEKEPEAVLDGYFEIHFIDVGYGDAALVICDDKTMLVDAGGSGKLISSYLAERNITYLDYVVSTHPHSDHAGGLAGALDAVDFGVALSPVAQYEDKSFQRFAEKVAEKGKTLTVPQVGDSFSLGDATVTVLGPLHTNYEDPNDLSLILHIVYGETSFLMTGDMEDPAEIDLMASGADLHSTLLKVGHHGKKSSTSDIFLKAVSPTYGVISIGTQQPAEEVLARLRDANVTLYRTDLHGNIVCKSDGKELVFQTSKTDAVTQDN